MRVAALYDIHGNLPALDAVLGDVRRVGIDAIVVGGDVLPGPLPIETLDRLLTFDRPVHFIHGNGDLAVLAQLDAADPSAVTYWGTTGGAVLPEPIREVIRWTARKVRSYHTQLRAWPKTMRLDIDGIGASFFCHATPRNETEIFVRTTPEAALRPLFDPLSVQLAVCGHTHMQFDRTVGATRVVNAGSVGMPFAEPGAYWLQLGPDIELRRTSYDLDAAATLIRRSDYPQAADFADKNVLHPPSEAAMLEAFSKIPLG